MNGWKLSKPFVDFEELDRLRKSAAAQAWVDRTGEKIAARARDLSGRQYRYEPRPDGPHRARGVVFPVGRIAKRSSLKNLTLIHAIDAGRD